MNTNNFITEYLYLSEDGTEFTHSTKNHLDKYADNQPCIKVEGYEDEIDVLLDIIFPTY